MPTSNEIQKMIEDALAPYIQKISAIEQKVEALIALREKKPRTPKEIPEKDLTALKEAGERIIDAIKQYPNTSKKVLATIAKVDEALLKPTFKYLLEKGQIVQNGVKQGTTYSLPTN